MYCVSSNNIIIVSTSSKSIEYSSLRNAVGPLHDTGDQFENLLSRALNFSYLGQNSIFEHQIFRNSRFYWLLYSDKLWRRLFDKERRYPKLFAQNTVFKRYIYSVIFVQPRKKICNSRIMEFPVFIEQNLKNIWDEQKV